MGPWHARRAGASHRRSELGRLDRVQRRGCSKRWMVETRYEPLGVGQKKGRGKRDRLNAFLLGQKKTETKTFLERLRGVQQ